MVSPLGPYKQKPLPLDRALPTPFPHQDSASDEVPSPLESTHDRDNHEDETENLTDSTARRLFKGVSQSPSPAAIAVEGTLFIFIATATARSVELYGDRYESGEKGGDSLSP